MSYAVFSEDFFAQPTLQVARALLGHYLIQRVGPKQLVYRIVETEAYTQDDPACHAYKRTVGRAATLYKKPGLAYVYLIYGMYHCLNVVTEPEGQAGAVLFRALEPLSVSSDCIKTNGPGRLTTALGITKQHHNEVPLTSVRSPLFLAQALPADELSGPVTPDEQIVETTRIGISQAADYPWRFYLKDNPWVSVR